jgi:hypothetical protein
MPEVTCPEGLDITLEAAMAGGLLAVVGAGFVALARQRRRPPDAQHSRRSDQSLKERR